MEVPIRPMISVIVPVYRVEKYLRACVDSIINQTYDNLEIILVDDGSPDNCPHICDEYARVDPRIVVIHKENGGLSEARNAGLAMASGEYIGFVDSDDMIAPTMYEVLMNLSQEYHTDMASVRYVEISENETSVFRHNQYDTRETMELDSVQYLRYVAFPTNEIGISFSVWKSLYRSELLKGLSFERGRVYEDVVFNTMANCAQINAPFATKAYIITG